MNKHITLFGRESGVSHEDFLDVWESAYVPAVTAVDGVVRYQRVVPTQPEHAEFDGISEVYFETQADLRAALSGDARTIAAGPPLPVAEQETFVGRETVRRDDVDGEADGLFKHSAFLVRQSGMGHDAFVEYWQDNHTPIARDIEGVVKYDTVVPADPDDQTFDGVAELYFADIEDLYAALGSEGSRDYDPAREVAQRAREDVDNFLAIDERPRLIGRNELLYDEG